MVNEPEHWASEREFFDAQALAAANFNLIKIAERYEGAMGRALYPLEVAYEILGDIRGKRLLDVGSEKIRCCSRVGVRTSPE